MNWLALKIACHEVMCGHFVFNLVNGKTEENEGNLDFNRKLWQ